MASAPKLPLELPLIVEFVKKHLDKILEKYDERTLTTYLEMKISIAKSPMNWLPKRGSNDSVGTDTLRSWAKSYINYHR